VIWLNGTYNTDISCYRIVADRLAGDGLLDLQQIIPLPEAKDFQIQQSQKGAATAAVRSGRDYTRYDVTVAGQRRDGLSKQAAVKYAIQGLYHAGVDPDPDPGRHMEALLAPGAPRPRRDNAGRLPPRTSGQKSHGLVVRPGHHRDGTSWVIPSSEAGPPSRPWTAWPPSRPPAPTCNG